VQLTGTDYLSLAEVQVMAAGSAGVPNPPNDNVKFATYTRDAATGLDYADQRYYSSQFGRFMSADPYMGSGGANNPQSWNRYTYGLADPLNHNDPRGLETCVPGGSLETVLNPAYGLNPMSADVCWEDPSPGGSPGSVPNSFLKNLVQMETIKYQPKLADAIAQLSSGCQTAIGNALGKIGQSFGSVSASSSTLSFVDVTATEGLFTVAQITGVNATGFQQTALAFSIPLTAQGAGAFVTSYTPPGFAGTGNTPVLPFVFLTSLFSSLDPAAQNVILVHEALHFASQMTDTQLASLLGATSGFLTGTNAGVQASQAISDWLQNNCSAP